MSDLELALVIGGMAVVTLVTRGFFLFPKRELPLPPAVLRGLRYAPLAALAAVVAPEIVTNRGELLATPFDARLFAAAAATAYFFWRRGILGTIVCGTVVLVVLRLGLGW